MNSNFILRRALAPAAITRCRVPLRLYATADSEHESELEPEVPFVQKPPPLPWNDTETRRNFGYPFEETSDSVASQANKEQDPQLNGYPQLPFISRQTLPPLGWQDNLMRRNFGDPLHEQAEVLSMWGPDPPPIPPSEALRQFSYAVAGFIGFGFLVKYVLLQDPPAVRREYPYNGLVKELGGLEENKARTEPVD